LRADNPQQGFTLIEMLIAMTLLSMMVVLLFSSLKVAAESWNAGEAKIIEVNRKAVVYQFFKRQIAGIRPMLTPASQDAVDGGAQGSAFQGQRQSLSFVGALPASALRKGLHVFEIAANPNNTTQLMVSLTPYIQSEITPPEKVVLLDHVKGFEFAYFGNKGDGTAAVWETEWVGFAFLPQLIKVSIRLDDDSFWPDMIFPIRVSALPSVASISQGAAPQLPN
jgi:general secretion pathway protein J